MIAINDDKDGGLRAIIPFCYVWCIDYEYRTPDGEPPVPICLVAKEVFSGQVRRMWRDDLLKMRNLPFDTGPATLVVSYHAPAEMACILELGGRLPDNVIDLYAEHRVETNGIFIPMGNGLLSALALRGINHTTSVIEKKSTIELIVGQSHYSEAQQKRILEYCESDVDALLSLFWAMAPKLDWARALLRGRYGKAVARMERNGIPIDVPLYRLFMHERDRVRRQLVAVIDRQYGVYDGLTFKIDGFGRWLRERHRAWPRTQTGRLELGDDVFKEHAAHWPDLRPLQELRQTLNALRLSDLPGLSQS
jgi:DNA polymerase I